MTSCEIVLVPQSTSQTEGRRRLGLSIGGRCPAVVRAFAPTLWRVSIWVYVTGWGGMRAVLICRGAVRRLIGRIEGESR